MSTNKKRKCCYDKKIFRGGRLIYSGALVYMFKKKKRNYPLERVWQWRSMLILFDCKIQKYAAEIDTATPLERFHIKSTLATIIGMSMQLMASL